jgi:hypothetical protein
MEKETEWMEFDPKNDPRVEEIKQDRSLKEVQDGCLGSVVLGIFFFTLGFLAVLLMA